MAVSFSKHTNNVIYHNGCYSTFFGRANYNLKIPNAEQRTLKNLENVLWTLITRGSWIEPEAVSDFLWFVCRCCCDIRICANAFFTRTASFEQDNFDNFRLKSWDRTIVLCMIYLGLFFLYERVKVSNSKLHFSKTNRYLVLFALWFKKTLKYINSQFILKKKIYTCCVHNMYDIKTVHRCLL